MGNVLNKKQITLLTANLLITKMLFAFPRTLFKTSGNAAWIQVIYMSLVAYALFELSLLFYKYTGNRSIIQIAESIGGKAFKIVVAILTVAVIGVSVVTEMRTYTESAKLILLPNSEIEYIIILFAITVGIGCACGLESIATINALFFPFCLFFVGVLLVSIMKNFDLNNLLPVLGTGKVFKEGLSDLSCFSDILALNLLLPYCPDIQTAKKSGRYAGLIAFLVIVAICLAYGLCYPYPYSSEFLLTTYQLSRMVRAGEYFQRFEALFEFIWSITQLLYASIYIYLICDVLSSTFKLRQKEALIPCTVTILVLLALEPSSIVGALDMSDKLRGVAFPIAYALPIAIPCLYLITGKAKNR